jgi:hypothetical protein
MKNIFLRKNLMEYLVGDRIRRKCGTDLFVKQIVNITDHMFYCKYIDRENIFSVPRRLIENYYELVIPEYIPIEQHTKYKEIRNG